MKRFLMFLVIAIAVTSIGLSIYYFAKDNEVIFINNTQISVNAGDTFKADDLLTFQNASKYTKVDYNGVKVFPVKHPLPSQAEVVTPEKKNSLNEYNRTEKK